SHRTPSPALQVPATKNLLKTIPERRDLRSSATLCQIFEQAVFARPTVGPDLRAGRYLRGQTRNSPSFPGKRALAKTAGSGQQLGDLPLPWTGDSCGRSGKQQDEP